jgi:hypothetical protein
MESIKILKAKDEISEKRFERISELLETSNLEIKELKLKLDLQTPILKQIAETTAQIKEDTEECLKFYFSDLVSIS